MRNVQKCDNCEDYRQKYLDSKRQNEEMRQEVARLTDKFDNIRRL